LGNEGIEYRGAGNQICMAVAHTGRSLLSGDMPLNGNE